MAFDGLVQAGQRHFFPAVQCGKKRFKLSLIGMIRNVSRIEEIHGKLAPPGLIQTAKLRRKEFVVEETPFATHEMGVKVIRLKTIDHGGALADLSIFEFQDRDARSGILI